MRILFAIGKEKKSVSEIMDETSLPQTLVSFHLRPLRESGIVATERKGPFIYYTLGTGFNRSINFSCRGLPQREER